MLKESAEKIEAWLQLPKSEWDIPEMALKLLQLNKNRVLYNSILRRPDKMVDKLEYELKKQLQFHFDHQTKCAVVEMEQQLMPEVHKELEQGPVINTDDDRPAAAFRGRREDHDSLPEEIQQLYVENGDIFFKMKSIYETLKRMEQADACDRYEHLKLLDELYKKYRDNWNRYDDFDPTKAEDVPTELTDEAEDPAELVKKIAAARKYISSNSKLLEKAIADNDNEEIAKLLPEIQERIDFILAQKQDFKEDYKERLKSLGLTFEG